MKNWGNQSIIPMSRFSPKHLRLTLIKLVDQVINGVPVNPLVISNLEDLLEVAYDTKR